MRGVNKAILVGTLGNDPDSKTFNDGGTATRISIATSEQWKDKQTGQQQERTEWHRVTFNGRLAEVAAQYLRKGSKVYIEGSLRTTKYQDKVTGADKYATDIRASQMQMLDSKPANGQALQKDSQNFTQQQPNAYAQAQQGNAPAQQQVQVSHKIYDNVFDDIPF